MRKIALALIALLLFSSAAFAQKTKADLITEINTNFPDNTTGLITPQILRNTTIDMVNSWQQYATVNAQTGTTYTFLSTDYGKLVTFSNGSAISATLPQATGSFATYNVYVRNKGVGAVTITPATSTINGAATLVLTTGQAAWVVSDGTNYQTANVTVTPAIGSITGLGTGVATWLATPSSANLAAALTDKTGTGVAVFGTSPTFTTSIVTPKVDGGAAAGSTLILESTSGAGTTDSIVFKTGSQTTAMTISTGQLVGINATPGASSRLLIEDGAGNNQLTLRYIGKSGVTFNQNSGGNFQFNLQDNNNFSIFTNNGSGGILQLWAGGAMSLGDQVDPGTSGAFTSTSFLRSKATTVSTSKTTGSIIASGGLGVAGATYTDTLNVITMANAATTSAVCYNTGTGLLTYDGTLGTCTVSLLAAKDLKSPLSPEEGYAVVMALQPWRYEMKEGLPTYVAGEQIGFVADYVAQVDIAKPVVAHNRDGTLAGFRYENYTAALTGAFKYHDAKIVILEAANDNLRAEIEQLKRRIAR